MKNGNSVSNYLRMKFLLNSLSRLAPGTHHSPLLPMANIEEAVGSSEDAGTLQQADCPAIAPVPPQFADDPDPTPCDKPDKRFVTFREVANNLMLGGG